MAGLSPAPLPSLSSLLNAALGSAGAPAPLPSLGMVLGSSSNRILSSAVGSYALTGNAVALNSARKAVSAAGSFSLTGVDSTLTKATPGFGIGAPASLPSLSLMLERASGNKLFQGGSGAFVVGSVATALARGHGLTAAAGAYAWTGAPALRDMQLTADKGTFSSTVNAATLTRSSPGVTGATGHYTMTGVAAGLVYQPTGVAVLSASFGSFALTGNDAALPSTINRVLSADKGTFAVSSIGASFVLIGWSPVDPSSGVWTNVSNASSAWTDV